MTDEPDDLERQLKQKQIDYIDFQKRRDVVVVGTGIFGAVLALWKFLSQPGK